MTTVTERVRKVADPWVPEGTTRGQLVTVAALVLIAASLAFRGWAVFGGWFYMDDLQWLAADAQGRADLAWVFSPHDSQYMPIGLALAKLVGSSGAYAWGAAATEIVVLQAVASLCCWWMLRTLFGSRPEILLLLTIYLTATATLPALMWWAVALNQIPLHAVLFVAVGAHVRYLRDGRRRWVALATAALLVGYLSYVKTLLVIPVLVAVTLAAFTRGSTWRRVRSAVVDHVSVWTVYGALTAGYLVLYRVLVPSPLDTTGAVDYPALADTLFRRSLGPALVGGPWRWDDRNPPVLTANTAETWVTVSWVVVLAAVVYLLLSRRRSARAGLVLVPYLALTLYLVGEGRASLLGDFAGLELRYLADVMAVVPLVAGLAWLPVEGAVETVERRAWPPTHPARGAVIVGLGAALVVSSTVSALPYVAAWHADFPTRAYVQGARDAVVNAPDRPVLADDEVPTAWLGGPRFPFNRPDSFLAPVQGRFTTSSAGTDLLLLGRRGELTAPFVEAGITARATADEDCGMLVRGGRTGRVDLGASTLDLGFWVVVGYVAGDTGTVRVRTGEQVRTARVEAGLHRLFVRSDGVFDRVDLTPSAGTDLCVDRVDVGTLVPGSAS